MRMSWVKADSLFIWHLYFCDWFSKAAPTFCHFFSRASAFFSNVLQNARQNNTKIRGSRRTCTCQLLWLMKSNKITQNEWCMDFFYHFREQSCEIGKCLCSFILLMLYAEEQVQLVITCQSRIVLDWHANVEWKSVNLCRKPWFPCLCVRRKQSSAYPWWEHFLSAHTNCTCAQVFKNCQRIKIGENKCKTMI